MHRLRLALPLCLITATFTPPAAAQLDLMRGLLSNAAASAAAGAAATAVTNAASGDAAQAPAAGDASAAAVAAPWPIATPAELQAIVQASPTALAVEGIKSNLALKGKRLYVAEYRLLFEVSGKVTASTRASYFGGIDRGATRVSVNYSLPQPQIELMQQITDRAWADFQAQMSAAGFTLEPALAFVQAHGAVYEAKTPATRPGAEVIEDVDLGHGTRRYMVFTPTGTNMLSRGFIGIGAGDIGKRVEYTRGNLEALSVGVAVNLAAQESSGSGSSMFRRGSSANASAAMELVTPHRQPGVIHALAQGQAASLPGAVPVPGDFATLRETGGYDTQKDAAVRAINVLGALTMGVAGNNSKRVDMTVDVDHGAMTRMVLDGVAGVHKASIASIQ